MIHAYDIHGILRVQSETALPELEYFAVGRLDQPADVIVHRGSAPDRVRGAEIEIRRVTVREILRNAGFAVTMVARPSGIDVYANWLVHRSPHVLYTNVVEPILRWLLVDRGFVFAHGACMAAGGEALLVTAETDTGKTTTILRTLDVEPYGFLSDDLTILSPDGTLRAYPKPLTISSHTVSAVRAARLSRLEQLTLPLQSRIHSRGGRRIAFWMTGSGLPVASINTVTQLVVPPPKYHVDRLIPNVAVVDEARLAGLAVIVRSERDRAWTLDPAAATTTLIANTDDAFGFPPYREVEAFMRSVVGDDLRERERAVISSALAQLPAMRFESASMNWAEDIRGWVAALGAGHAERIGESAPIPNAEVVMAAGDSTIPGAPTAAGRS